ncbi:NAD(+)/NADH kinase [Sporosalibacterium faouarense]|uniref:NAD(+)/NADH kinase n=1 Tax=Sporosalibacterium faouarense TaxID=516123 RepID=UPI00141C5AD4|nr:NAD(+)/NADH kinase [Sporosalibacterium faouarense]MTI49831.1 NAD(+)/NADH kinase [Bacillota bacterium]
MTNCNLNNHIINIIHNNDKESIKTAEELAKKLKSHGYQVSNTYDYCAELNICIGGDGAFLRAVHNYSFPDIPFVGVNTGHLGFFQEISPSDLDNFIESYKKKDYTMEEIYLVEAIICTRTSCIELVGINEIVIKGINSKVIHMNVSIADNYLERFSGDGLIISTPTGSTAYSYSAGGSIIFPTLKVLQITPLAPISSKVYRSLTTSAIVQHDMVIKVNPEYRDENSILMVVDGIQHKYDNIVEINLKLSDMTINKLTLDPHNFWWNLKDKFI